MENNKIVSFRDVTLTDGFWKKRYELNKNVSIAAVRNKFEESARFDALRFNYLKNGRQLHYFYDSDAAKWIEGVAYLIEHDRESQKDNEAFIDELVRLHGGGSARQRLSQFLPPANHARRDF